VLRCLLQSVAVNIFDFSYLGGQWCVVYVYKSFCALYCSVLQCVAVCDKVLQCCSLLQYSAVAAWPEGVVYIDESFCKCEWAMRHVIIRKREREQLYVAVCCSVLQCVAVCCCVLLYDAV